MNKANGKLGLLYFIVTLPVCLFLIFSDIFGAESNGGIWLAIAWYAITSLGLIVACTVKDFQKTQLLGKCRPREYIAYAEAMLPAVKERNQHSKNIYRINLFVAYHSLGQFEKAAQYLMQVEPNFPDNRSGIWAEHPYRINLSTHYLFSGDLDQAQQELQRAQELLRSDKLNGPTKDAMFLKNQLQQYEINMRRGNIEGAQTFFENLLSVEKNPYSQVNAHWNLAQIYLYNKEYGKARAACGFITENGGETYYVGQAQAMLAELDALEQA